MSHKTINLSLGTETVTTMKRLSKFYGPGCSLSTLVRRAVALLEDELINLENDDARTMERGVLADYLPAHPAPNPPR